MYFPFHLHRNGSIAPLATTMLEEYNTSTSNKEVAQTDFWCALPLQTLLGGMLWKAANPPVRPPNFKGSVIKEALTCFSGHRKTGQCPRTSDQDTIARTRSTSRTLPWQWVGWNS
ncbi:MAG: hypothetical protein ACX93O_03845 [Flagellimonas sp.]